DIYRGTRWSGAPVRRGFHANCSRQNCSLTDYGEAKMRFLQLMAVGIALVGCEKPAPLGPQPTQRLGEQLNAAQIRQEMVGNTGTGHRTSTNSVYSMYVAPDGTLIEKLPTRTETGRWRITDDGHFCMH